LPAASPIIEISTWPVERHKLRAGNQRGQPAARLEGNDSVSLGVQHQCRDSDLGGQIADIIQPICHDDPDGDAGEGRAALEIIEPVELRWRASWYKQGRRDLPERGGRVAPADLDDPTEGLDRFALVWG